MISTAFMLRLLFILGLQERKLSLGTAVQLVQVSYLLNDSANIDSLTPELP